VQSYFAAVMTAAMEDHDDEARGFGEDSLETCTGGVIVWSSLNRFAEWVDCSSMMW
jgi:hypothetical protein